MYHRQNSSEGEFQVKESVLSKGKPHPKHKNWELTGQNSDSHSMLNFIAGGWTNKRDNNYKHSIYQALLIQI